MLSLCMIASAKARLRTRQYISHVLNGGYRHVAVIQDSRKKTLNV